MNESLYFRNGAPVSATEFRSDRLRERYYRVFHPSGLTIYLFPKEHSTVSALYATRFGAASKAFRYEDEEKYVELPDGCAHFLEHKMFEQADGSDAFRYFSELGADANAYTSWDKTAYLFHATEQAPDCLRALLKFVSEPYFTDVSVEKEQGIIAEEIRMNDESPAERCFMNLLGAMYERNAIRNEICGSEASIARITPQILYECCEAFYTPSNMALVVAGNITLGEVVEAVDAVLVTESVEHRRVICRDENLEETAAVFRARVEERMPVGKPIFVIGVKDHAAVSLSPKERMRRDALMTVIKEMYFSTSSELYNRLFDAGVISPGFSAAYGATPLYAFFEIAGESDDCDYVLAEVKKTIRTAAETGVDDEIFERARRVLYAKTVKSFDSTKTVSEMLLDYVFADYELFEYVELLGSITKEGVETLLREAFPDEAFALSVVSPLDTEESKTEVQIQ